MQGGAGPEGSVGHGQELPGGACHTGRHMDALAQAGAGAQHLPPSPPSGPGAGIARGKPRRWKGREERLLSCRGGVGQRTREREVSGSMGGTWGRQDQSPGSSQPLIAKRHRMRPYTHSPNQIMDFKFLPRGSGVTARQSRMAAGSRSSPPRGSPSPESVQESEAGGGDIMQ